MSEAGLLADPQEVRAILIASAQAGLAISYSEVLALLGHDFTRPKMRALCRVLSFVDDEAEERGEPELAVLVVRQSDGLPGQGWWVGGAKKHGYAGLWEGPKAAKLIRRLQFVAVRPVQFDELVTITIVALRQIEQAFSFLDDVTAHRRRRFGVLIR